MNKFLFIIFSIFTLVHSSIIWTPDELAKYINENYELGDTLLFDDKSYITDEHREKINAIMKRITNQNDVFVYGIFLDEINLNSYRIDVFFEKVVEALKVPEYVDKKKDNRCDGLTFVITGKLGHHYKNRDELKKIIENAGGKVTSAVSSKTDYLINNDINSNSEKNVTAQRLNVPILTEDEFFNLFN